MQNGGISSSDEEAMPRIEIVEQPKSKGYRFRYGCEGKTAGNLPGENTSPNKKTSPSFRLVDIPQGCSVIAVVSCVTTEGPYRPHPHKLVGKDCDKGVCTIKMKRANSVQALQHMGIQCVKRKEVESSLRLREQIKVNPYNTPFYEDDYPYDLKKVRLAIQAFIQDNRTGQHIPLAPVLTDIVYDHKSENELGICRLDRNSSEAKGGQEVFLLCEKVNKDDIQVHFSDDSGWEAWGDFSPNDVHKQYAIVFKTPAYRDQSITRAVEVKIQLYRQSDDCYSEAKVFIYKPNEQDEYGIHSKRKRKSAKLNLPGPGPQVPALEAFNRNPGQSLQNHGQSTQNPGQSVQEDNKPTIQDLWQMIRQLAPKGATPAQSVIVSEALPNHSSPDMDVGSPIASTSSYSPPEPGANSPSPSGVVYPKTTALGPNTPRLDDLMSSQASISTSHGSHPTIIPSTVNQLTETRSSQPAPIPTLLPGSQEGVTVSEPIMATETNPQDLFAAMTARDQDTAYLALNGVVDSSFLEDQMASDELMKYINMDVLEADDGGKYRKKKTNRRRNAKKK